MRSTPFGLVVIAVCGLIVLAAGIRVGIWAHQAEAIMAREESVGDQLLVLRQTMAGLLALENSERFYLSTGDAADLSAYDQDRRDLAAALNRLDAVFRDDPVQSAKTAELAKLAHAAEDEAARMVALPGEGRRAAALDSAGADHTRNAMAAFRAGLNSVLEPLAPARSTLHEQAAEKFREIYVLLAFVVLVVNLLIVVAFVSLSIAFHRLREAHHEHLHKAMYEVLTGLPNRRYLNEWLAMSLAAAGRGGRHLALLYVDLE